MLSEPPPELTHHPGRSNAVSSELCGIKTPDNKRSYSPTALRRVETVAKFTVPRACPMVESLSLHHCTCVYVTLTNKDLTRDPAKLNHTRKTGPEGASAVPNLVYLPPGKERSNS